ncbi:ester cyclase [Nocardia sp. NPDC050378]|uniref:nuclear transport factor 2 family protein n=1 Tax=Nocardia sp. NPDC050378 TaxID=3155400 RepID=UPI0033D5F179
MADASVQARNKEVVRQFVETLLNDRNPEKASELMGNRYIQHVPGVADGREAFLKDIHDHFLDPFPNARLEIKRLIAEDDLVVCHAHIVLNSADPADRGLASFDMFRLEDGGIVEHWVAAQPVPDGDPVNSNTMF